MKSKYIILLLITMLLVVPSLAASQTVSFTQDGIWTCPSDVNSVNLKEIGGGSGGVGGYYWIYNYVGGFIGSGNGAGGNAGTYVTHNNIPVTPGQSYSIVVGRPGNGVGGKYLTGIDGTNYYYYGNPGEDSSAFGYIAAGGVAPYISWISYPSGDGGFYSITLSSGSSSSGANGYGNYQIASTGFNGVTGTSSSDIHTSYGSPGGIGYGAGGGGGGAGSPVSGYIAPGGTGGNGAYGYVEITYDSSSTLVIPTGYVVDADTSAAISGAVINATQSGITYSISSSVDGSFNMDNASLTYGVPLTIMTNKSGYASDVNTFTPLASGPINLTIPLIPTAQYSNTRIVGIVRDSLYGNPISSATYYAQDTTTSVISTATSNTRGLAIVTGLTSDHFYYVWANKTGYSSPSPVLVKPYS
jgi:hypothetical protein